MQINPYLHFNGNAEEALEFYRGVFGGEVEIMRFGGTPAAEHAPADWKNKVLHGRLKTPGGELMAADSTTHRANNPDDNFSLAFTTEDESEADAVFAKLSTGGTVTTALENTFWGAKFGMATDKFGIAWMVNCALQPAAT